MGGEEEEGGLRGGGGKREKGEMKGTGRGVRKRIKRRGMRSKQLERWCERRETRKQEEGTMGRKGDKGKSKVEGQYCKIRETEATTSTSRCG